MEAMVVQKWIHSFVESEYFDECEDHNHHGKKEQSSNITKKNDKNLFCVDCIAGPLCETGSRGEHWGHLVLQVRKASHSYAVRCTDIWKLWNIDEIQTYSINGAKIVFLPSRPQSKPAKGAEGYCRICSRSLTDPVQFCSISCKIKFIESPGIPGSPLPVLPPRRAPKKRSRSPKKEYVPFASSQALESFPSDEVHGVDSPSPSSVLSGHGDQARILDSSSSLAAAAVETLVSFRKNWRKGVPHRAPGVGPLACEGLMTNPLVWESSFVRGL